jgi:hypothetical protein
MTIMISLMIINYIISGKVLLILVILMIATFSVISYDLFNKKVESQLSVNHPSLMNVLRWFGRIYIFILLFFLFYFTMQTVFVKSYRFQDK